MDEWKEYYSRLAQKFEEQFNREIEEFENRFLNDLHYIDRLNILRREFPNATDISHYCKVQVLS